MHSLLRIALCCGTLLLVLSPAAGRGQPPRPFVRVSGTRFLEGERPFFFVGANLNVMHGPKVRANADRTIAAAAADGLQVGRVWALGEGLPRDPSWKRRHFLFRAGPQGWVEETFVQLDRVIAEAGRHGMRLVITLSNRWTDYGGIFMYLRWAGQVQVEEYGYSDLFFSDPRCRRWFVQHVRRIVGRTNSLTGLPYRDDPTIMTWELQNEMSGTPEAAALRRAWFSEMAREIRGLDPNHLVVPGLIGYDLQVERESWIAMCRLQEVSYCDQHIYPEERVRSRGLANMRLYVDDRVQLAHHVVGKPVVFGEFGFADRASPRSRARRHELFLQRLFYDGGNGALVWIYQPTLSWSRTYPVLWDSPRYTPVRRALHRMAGQVARREPVCRNRSLGPDRGERPIAPTHALLVRERRPHAGWIVGHSQLLLPRGSLELQRLPPEPDAAVLQIPVDRFARAWFEEAGSWDGGIFVHAYGRRTGWFEYRFRGPAFVPSRLVVWARLSSEFPGRSSPPGGSSRVAVLLDGQQVAVVQAMADDGQGAWHEIPITDPALLARLSRGEHTLRFSVEPGPKANGVAIYGSETELNREPVDDPGPLQIVAYL